MNGEKAIFQQYNKHKIVLKDNVDKWSESIYNGWKTTHSILINGKDAQEDQMLLIHAALQSGGTATSLKDGNDLTWVRTVTMKDVHTGIYRGDGIERDITIIPLELSSVDTSPGEFTLTTQNCLYTEHSIESKEWSVWEWEMLGKTAKYNKNKVTEENIGWGQRIKRLNISHDEQLPDLLLLQECTNQMFKELNESLGNIYEGVHSKYGCCRNHDGFCWVLWKKTVFKKEKVLSKSIENCRFVAVKLSGLGRSLVVISTHLPSSGKGTTALWQHTSKELTASEKNLPVLIGGDFNVTNNPFQTFAFDNLSGEKPTFYNDMTAKFDWVVGKGLTSSHISVNETTGTRWPNPKEGSDHTAIRMRVQFTT